MPRATNDLAETVSEAEGGKWQTQMNWRQTTLGEICDQTGGTIQTGPFGSQLHESDYSAEGIPVVMPKDIVEGRITTDTVARVSPTHVERLSRHKLRSGDIVYGRRGDIGRQALITKEQEGWMCGTGCLRLSFGDSVINPVYLHYYLRQDDVISWISNQAVGATMPNLNTGILRKVPVRLPPLHIQRRIASNLAAYDDLIDNNTRRIHVLERMVQAIYREWFVNFRFPGHAKGKLVASPLGPIPQGWTVQRLDQVAEVNTSTIRRGCEPERIVYIDIASVVTGRIEKAESMSFPEAPGRARRTVAHGDTIWSCVRPNRKSYALLVNPSANLIVSTGFAVLRPTKVPFTFFHQAVTTDEFVGYLTNHATGAAYPAVTAKDFEPATLLIPNGWLLDQFHEHCEPHLLLKENLLRRTMNLRRARDLLLPRLLSGQMDVSNLSDE